MDEPTRARSNLLLALIVLTAGCGGPAPNRNDADMDVVSDSATGDSATADSTTDGNSQSDVSIPTDAQPDASTVPNISQVFSEADCRAMGGRFPQRVQADRGDMHRITLNGDAICGDGSPAMIYVRRATQAAMASRWIIHLEGGGGCGDYEACRIRWCGLEPQYDATNMSTRWMPNTIGQGGIFADGTDNPYAGANHVFVNYCSSDGWSGQMTNGIATSPTNPSQRYSIHRRGHTIVAQTVERLRSGMARSDDGMVNMPDLDEATVVIFSGSSAGSVGVHHNTDWFRSQLPATVDFRAVFDAGFNPLPENFTDTTVPGREIPGDGQRIEGAPGVYPFLDESCLAMHAADPGLCSDFVHVGLHHITTPFFQRMDLRDTVHFDNFRARIDGGVSLSEYATALIPTLAQLATVRTTAEERAQITVEPGIYGPNCARHIAIMDTDWFTRASLADTSGTNLTFRAALTRWLAGMPVNVVDTQPGTRSTCIP